MNKEILEITKKFHDTYEKLASEYTYETREDTKVFDINSNNGKLMYATVNEIVSPILKENKILKENAENNDKVVDKINWENMLLKKEIEQLQQQCRKQKEVIIRAIALLNNPWSFERGNKEVDEITYNKKRKVIDILKGSDSDE